MYRDTPRWPQTLSINSLFCVGGVGPCCHHPEQRREAFLLLGRTDPPHTFALSVCKTSHVSSRVFDVNRTQGFAISRVWVATASKCFRVPGAQSHDNQDKAVSPGKMGSQPSHLECSFPRDCPPQHSPKASGEEGQGSRTMS